jgi:hypothetical protein
VFRDSAVDNLCGFFERFRSLDVRSNQQLDELVTRAQRAVRGVAAQDIRDSHSTRREVVEQLSRRRDKGHARPRTSASEALPQTTESFLDGSDD